MCCKSLPYLTRIGVIPQCDKGNAKPFEAANERLGASGRLVSWGGLSIRPIGSKTLYQLRKASRTPGLQAPLPVHSLYMEPVHPTLYMQEYPRKGRGVKHFVLALLRPYLGPPKLNVNDVRNCRYLHLR